MSVASPVRPGIQPDAGRHIDLGRAQRALAWARRAGRASLLETEGLEILDAIGIAVPEWVFVPEAVVRAGGGVEARDLASLHGDRAVVKVVAAAIAHKTEAGGVAIVARDAATIAATMRDMIARLAGAEPAGCLVTAFVDHDASLSGELLVALRWTRDFGPVVAVGPGGVHAELLAKDLRPGAALAMVSTAVEDPAEIEAALRAATVVRLVTEPQRGRPPQLPMAALVDVVERLLAFGRACPPEDLLEIEMNPMAIADGRLIALDVLARLDGAGPGGPGAGTDRREPTPRRSPPAAKLDRLLRPRSIALVGVSGGENIGRTILRNTLRAGFDPAAVTVVKPGATDIDGCRCVPDLASLPSRVDLLVVAVAAAVAADLIAEAIERDSAEAIVVIPGGFDETAGGAGHARRIRAALAQAAGSADGGPVLNGGNCMGVRSRPGRYDTLFVPEVKLAGPGGRPVPLAIVAQSGAFAISRLSRLEGLDPAYVITVGNQLDLTVGDHLEHLADDQGIRVVGVYVEGFAALDGLRFLRAAGAIRRRGGTVILYRAGRTTAGAKASASHTAAIAGDAVVTETLARAAGVVVAETVEAFDDLVGAFVRLDGRPVAGARLGALTNAGFECVAIGDTLGDLRLEPFDEATTSRLREILAARGLAGVVDVHNPFDLTPMGGDAAFAEVAGAILDSPAVDVGLIGNVPFTQTMRTLPGEDLAGAGAVAERLGLLWRRTTKPWVTVVDAGPRYDPLVRALEMAGIPTFRTADAAMRALRAFAAVGAERATAAG